MAEKQLEKRIEVLENVLTRLRDRSIHFAGCHNSGWLHERGKQYRAEAWDAVIEAVGEANDVLGTFPKN